MMTSSIAFPKAFAICFKDLERWDPSSFHRITWHWPKHLMVPIGSVLQLRKERVDRAAFKFCDLQPVTIHFDGSMDRRIVDPDREYTMDLWFARPGDIVVAKIDLKNGAVGIVPKDWANVVVTGHFAVYKPDHRKIVPEYLHRIIQTDFFKAHLWRNKVGAEGRKEVKLDFFEREHIPLPPLAEQKAIVAIWRKAMEEVEAAKGAVDKFIQSVDTMLKAKSNLSAIGRNWLCVQWQDIHRWDMKSARAALFRLNNSSFRPMGEFVEEATELVKPWQEPGAKKASPEWLEKEWPVYGVNNKDGVFFSHRQKAREFNAPYKHIEKDWFFHNPTRSSVGSLGIVPDVPDDAITSPEYQVWRIKDGLVPSFVAAMISTDFFIKLIQFHRVGAVKQRLYVENLLEIPIPMIPLDEQQIIGEAREKVLEKVRSSLRKREETQKEVEGLILGTISIEEMCYGK